ncbi:MAG: DUF669 domain-containing protein [Candidatus Marsarchaeota archaeon]|nr:DUF669 domain-containing protein [Candidatus Marsarchaeota archaeon]
MSTDYSQNQDIDSFDLSEFDGDFSETTVEDREFGEVPDGKYQVKVDQVELTRAHTSGSPMLKWTLKILAPNFVGRLLWRNNVISSDNLKWLKTDLHTCGLELDKLSELPNRIQELKGVTLEVTQRTKGNSKNIFLNRRIVIDLPNEADDALAPF